MSATLHLRAGAARARVPIALVTSSMEGGGAQRAVAKLAAGLVQQGHSVDLVLAHARGPYLAELPPAVRVVDLEVSRMATAVVPLARYLRRERPDVVFSVLDYVNVVSVAARMLSRIEVRLVVSERNTLSTAVANAARRRTRLMPLLVRWAYPRADAVVAVSQGVAEDLVNGFGIDRSRVHVLNNPVVTPETQRMRQEPARHPWLRDPTVPVVLAVGRLVPQKDFATLLDAFALVRKEREARLVVLGEGPLRPELESAVRRLGLRDDVDLAGFDANPYAAMAAASAFVLSSRWEGSPGVLIEALSCGTPVVATDCPSGPRQILDDGRFGRLVPVGDASSMAAGLVDALDGRVPRGCHESWAPYEQATVVAEYVDLLRGKDPS
jgi:glycosyltransferase involved in cell wall biosynthesis